MPQTLKIALVLETGGGGSGRHVLDLAEGLAELNHDVTIFWSPVRAQDDFTARLMQLDGVENQPLDMHRAVGLADYSSLRALHRLIQKHGPFDIIHGHSSKAGALVRLLPRSTTGARVYTPHAFRTMDPTMGSTGRRVYGGIERLLAHRCARIICVSAAESAHAEALGVSRQKLVTVLNGITMPADAERMKARAQMGLAPDEIAVGFIGRLNEQKAPLRFVRAVAQAAKKAPFLRGVVIGDGPLRNEAEALNTQGSVRFLGWQDGPRLFAGLDIFCMTSQYEAMPYTLLEALQAGLPIVTTTVGGVAETISENKNGFILPTDCEPSAIAEKLVTLAFNPDQRNSFGQQSATLGNYQTIGRMVTETLSVYKASCKPVYQRERKLEDDQLAL